MGHSYVLFMLHTQFLYFQTNLVFRYILGWIESDFFFCSNWSNELVLLWAGLSKIGKAGDSD
jgi:hypothetical protein